MTEIRNNYNLEERTVKFGEDVIRFCKIMRQDVITRPIITQLIRSGTSIGANYNDVHMRFRRSRRDQKTLEGMPGVDFNFW